MSSPLHVAIVASSLNAGSTSQILAAAAHERLTAKSISSDLIDLRQNPLPFCGSGESWGDPRVAAIKKRIVPATHILFAVPVYNYDVNAAAKNVVELVGKDGFENKIVGFACAAGGQGSFMSVMSLANSLMLDFRCWIVPRFLYVTEDVDAGLPAETSRRLDELLEQLVTA